MKVKTSSLIIILTVVLLCLALSAPVFAVPDDSISSQNITEADGISGQDTNSGTGIKTGHIQDGAVTDAKISGQISASKISSAGLDADTVDGVHASDLAPVVHTHAQSDVTGLVSALASKADAAHNHDGLYQKKYANVIVVAKSGGDFADPLSAMNSITNASATNPYLVKIMPGIYNVGGCPFMKPYVDIEGSGENTTTIQGDCGMSFGVINAGSNSEIRYLTIENTGGGDWAVGLRIDVASVKISHVTAKASGSRVNAGILTLGATFVMNDVTGIGTGGTAVGSSAIGISIDASTATLSNVTASAADGYTNRGVNVYNSWTYNSYTVEMNSITARATGGYSNVGISYSGSNIPLTVTNANASASGGTNANYGIMTGETFTGSNINASGDYGFYSMADTTLYNSILTGSISSVYNSGALGIGNSQLNGAITGSGTYQCFGVYDNNFAPVICP